MFTAFLLLVVYCTVLNERWPAWWQQGIALIVFLLALFLDILAEGGLLKAMAVGSWRWLMWKMQ